jgi:hypothetical protein
MRNHFGENNPFFGKKHSLETRLKISLAQKGRVSPKKGKKYPRACGPHLSMRGRHSNPKTEFKKGMNPWNKGLTKETSSIVKELAERPRKTITLQRRRDAVKGSKCWNWQGGKTPLSLMIGNSLEFKEWRKSIFSRDNWTCQKCFIRGGKLHPHHKRLFSEILKNFLFEYSQFSPAEDKEILSRIAITYKPFWNVENGITLCEACHKETHKLLREQNDLAKHN